MIAITTTLKSTPEQTSAFVRYHLNTGIDHIFLFFDDPNDESIGRFDSETRVTETVCDKDYWKTGIPEHLSGFDPAYLVYRQRINATNALHWAREKGIEWICHIDVDELIYTGRRSLKNYLQQTPFCIIRFTLLEVVPEKFEYKNIFAENSLFKMPAAHKFPTTLRYPWNSLMLKIAKFIGVQSPFFVTNRYFRAHTKSKVIVRTDLDIKDMRIHGPECTKSCFEYRARKLFLLHYDSCGYQFWLDRWRFKLGGSEKPKQSKQEVTRYMMSLLAGSPSDEELRDAYEKLHFITPKDQRKLRRLGLIKKIDLPETLF
ncbi:MAG: glycosyltransferase family 2 protein [Spirochaetaceae bacterium]|nr:glycosyltransferase family 2 protein [Spirochaetaceae bacterium]